MSTLLYENSRGIKIIREDKVKRSCVKVVGLDGSTLMTYRFNNVPEYKHPYLSWENLDHCGGWTSDDTYLLSAVQDGKKPAAQYYYGLSDFVSLQTKGKSVELCIDRRHNWILITRTCSLHDIFDIDSIIAAYKNHDIYIEKEMLIPYMEKPIMDLMKEKFFITPANRIQLIITGLMLGYPIESTASLLSGY